MREYRKAFDNMSEDMSYNILEGIAELNRDIATIRVELASLVWRLHSKEVNNLKPVEGYVEMETMCFGIGKDLNYSGAITDKIKQLLQKQEEEKEGVEIDPGVRASMRRTNQRFIEELEFDFRE